MESLTAVTTAQWLAAVGEPGAAQVDFASCAIWPHQEPHSSSFEVNLIAEEEEKTGHHLAVPYVTAAVE